MVRIFIAALACVALVSCGGGRSRGTPSASGEMSRACMQAGRDSASASLCGCVQAAANQTLNGSDQARAAEFFADPQKAQDTRTSDNSGTEAFWQRYRTFVSTAEALCRS